MSFNSIKINITRSKKICYTGTNVIHIHNNKPVSKVATKDKTISNKFMFKAVQLVIKQMNLKSTIAS